MTDTPAPDQPQPITIYNLRKGPPPDGVILVDRRTVWGNPFVMHDESQRDEVCEKFEQYAVNRLANQPDWLAPLRGKDLACWCTPKRCHAETLMRLANE